MRNLKPTVLLFAFLSTVIGLYSQAPGFCGRKDIVHGNLYFFPRLSELTNDPDPSRSFSSHFNATKSIGYDRVLSRRSVFGPELDLTRRNDLTNYIEGPGRMTANAWGVGLRFRSYSFLNRGWIAPLGIYFGLTFRTLFVTRKFFPDDTRPDFRLPSRMTWSFGILMGRTIPLSSRLLLDMGLRLCFTDVGSIIQYINSDTDFLYMGDLFKVHIGISFLP